MDLRIKFKRYLLDENLTATQFAKKMGYTRPYVSRIINGNIKPGRKFLEELQRQTGKIFKKSDFINADKRKGKPQDSPKTRRKKQLLLPFVFDEKNLSKISS
jgi:transcriptional regulator with XRE-family HTH domain